MTQDPPLEVVAAVIAACGTILACRRRPGVADAGSWEFPGGKVEPGESARQALVREIREELGVGIHVGEEMSVDDTVVHGRTIRLRCFRATLTDASPAASTDHDEMRWVAPADLAGLRFAAPDLPAVRLLASGAAG